MIDSTNAFMLLSLLSMATILMIFGMKYFSAAKQSRKAFDTDGINQDLKDKLATLQEDMASVKKQVTGIEKVLKEIE
ncbi:MAG: hypothetical protein ABJN40_17285 [Sneathiella sp.]